MIPGSLKTRDIRPSGPQVSRDLYPERSSPPLLVHLDCLYAPICRVIEWMTHLDTIRYVRALQRSGLGSCPFARLMAKWWVVEANQSKSPNAFCRLREAVCVLYTWGTSYASTSGIPRALPGTTRQGPVHLGLVLQVCLWPTREGGAKDRLLQTTREGVGVLLSCAVKKGRHVPTAIVLP